MTDHHGQPMIGGARRLYLIKWLTRAEGGRKRVPAGDRYVAPAAFDAGDGRQWSLVVDFVGTPDTNHVTGHTSQLATVRFLAPDAPHHLLQGGATFCLFEGLRAVATGEVLGGPNSLTIGAG